jgi:hypothetical protein
MSVLGWDVDGDMVWFRMVSCHVTQCYLLCLSVFCCSDYSALQSGSSAVEVGEQLF